MKLIIFLFCFPMVMLAQNLNEFKWQKRVVIVQAPTFDDEQAVAQIALLKREEAAFSNFKLCVIESTNQGERLDFGVTKRVRHIEKIVTFKVILVGLDGGVKFESNSVVEVQKIFDLINAMPMRQNEKNRD